MGPRFGGLSGGGMLCRSSLWWWGAMWGDWLVMEHNSGGVVWWWHRPKLRVTKIRPDSGWISAKYLTPGKKQILSPQLFRTG